MNYLLVTHIPFARNEQGHAVVDGLWARDLIGLCGAMGPLRVAAPQMESVEVLRGWGPNTTELPESSGISFAGFPPAKSPFNVLRWPRTRSVLRREVARADIVHTSNLFPPYQGLSYAHDLAVKTGKKSVFIIAEDFHDMLSWEWIRPVRGFERWKRERMLRTLDRRARRSAGTASLTLLHTPASVGRYRLSTRRSFAIRQPGHELDQVIAETVLEERLASLAGGRALNLVAACRHSRLKGLDLLIRAIALLANRNIEVNVTLYGEGAETEMLRRLTHGLGVERLITMPGALAAGAALDASLQKADLFVMPHRTNDFGRAFFDAMAAGLPVLAFRTPASAETVYDGQDGFLAPLDDVQGLAEHITTLYFDRARLAAASRAARRRALSNTRSEWFRLRAEWTRALLDETAATEA